VRPTPPVDFEIDRRSPIIAFTRRTFLIIAGMKACPPNPRD